MKTLAILISNAGTGTNLQAIIDAVEAKKIEATISAVISDSEDAPGLVRARKHSMFTYVLKTDESLTDYVSNLRADYVLLSGWKKIISDQFITMYPLRILNIHPGLIPNSVDGSVLNPDGTQGLWNRGKFTKKAIQNFLDSGATYAGSTIHFLSKEFDFGPVLGRCFEKIIEGDTVETLYPRLKVKENKLYVDVLKTLCK